MKYKMESYENILAQYRNYWANDITRDEDDHKAIFSVLHGIVERTNSELYSHKIAEYFTQTLEKLKTKRRESQILNPQTLVELIKPAIEYNLPVKTPRDLDNIKEIRGMFGVVSEIEDDEARLSMSIPEGRTNPGAPLWESEWFNLSRLPKEYQRENVWVAWIEYQFKDGKEAVGNFEPASTHPDTPITS